MPLSLQERHDLAIAFRGHAGIRHPVGRRSFHLPFVAMDTPPVLADDLGAIKEKGDVCLRKMQRTRLPPHAPDLDVAVAAMLPGRPVRMRPRRLPARPVIVIAQKIAPDLDVGGILKIRAQRPPDRRRRP